MNHTPIAVPPLVGPITVKVADTSDETAFPELAAARRHLAAMSPERREQLDREWKGM